MSLNEPKHPAEPRARVLPPPPAEAIAAALGVPFVRIDWLAGDGSDRCYYRLRTSQSGPSLVLMQLSGQDARALRESGYDWIKIASALESHGVKVPAVVKALPEHAALIIEDYGDVMLESQIFALADGNRGAEVRTLYRRAAAIVGHFLTIPKAASAVWCQRAFDAERLGWELRFFMQQYLTPIAGVTLTGAELAAFEADTAALSAHLAGLPQYFVHRDFHSRNVMVRGDELAVIDFQDARLGPAAYDVVSLCFDSYVPFTGRERSALLAEAVAIVGEMAGAAAQEQVSEHWCAMLLQRQLKAIGSFGYLTREKGKGDYLRYVDPALRTLEDQLIFDARWPFLSGELVQRMRRHVDLSSDSPRHD